MMIVSLVGLFIVLAWEEREMERKRERERGRDMWKNKKKNKKRIFK